MRPNGGGLPGFGGVRDGDRPPRGEPLGPRDQPMDVGLIDRCVLENRYDFRFCFCLRFK